VGCAASAVAAQAPVGLALEDVLQATLRDNPNIQIAARGSDSQRGALVAAGDAFDAKLQSAFGNNRFNTLRADPFGSRSPWLDTNLTQYSVGVQKLLRQGILLSPELGVSRTALPSLGIQATSQATAKLSVVVPLLKDRGGFVTGAPERAAARSYEGSTFQTQHVTAQSILSAVVAYWDYHTATSRLAVLADSETRARRLFEDTRRLVEAGERPPSDLAQVQGNVAAKRVTRMSAEQAVVDTRVRLGLVMGLGPTETAALGEATTPFPQVDEAGAETIAVPALVDRALADRADLRATEKTVESARLLYDAARENLKPRVDLVTSIGYAGLQIGGSSLASLFSPVFRNVPGPDFTIAFRYQAATANVGARGVLLQNESSYAQERLVRQELQRQIRTGVYQASESIERNAIAMTEAHQAVASYEATVRSEQRKFQLGVTTLFDTINAADALTSVKLAEIAVQREYAVALATLRFQAGSLVAAGPTGPTVDVRLFSAR
jgi:outer membrane protein TolC